MVEVGFHKGREIRVVTFHRIKENGYKHKVWKRLTSDLLYSSLSVLELAVERFNILVIGLI